MDAARQKTLRFSLNPIIRNLNDEIKRIKEQSRKEFLDDVWSGRIL